MQNRTQTPCGLGFFDAQNFPHKMIISFKTVNCREEADKR